MPPTPDDALQSPQESDSEASGAVPRQRPAKSPLSSVARLPYRRSNASLSNLFASTTSLPSLGGPASRSVSPSVTTPSAGVANGSVFSPGGTTAAPSPSFAQTGESTLKDSILQAFSPHVSVLASPDTEELIRHKGVPGGLLALLRPFGEHVPGKVTIRDSIGVSRSWEDFAIRFIGVKDGLESPRITDRRSTDSAGSQKKAGQRTSLLEYRPARLRSGGDVQQIEELVERHLTFAEEHSGPVEADYITSKDEALRAGPHSTSPFYTLYLRRLLSGLPVVPSESFSHPVAMVVAISSRSPSPIEELRSLYDSSNTGEHRLPQWVHNEFLRYYVLIHDEDYDDITKSMALYDQMKRHFGLHCHLLRLRSTQCVPSDDDSIKLPSCDWTSAAEELAEIVRRETNDDDDDPTPCIFESDASAVRTFVREMVTQSIIPSMERSSAAWNELASRRRGLSGRFMSLSKRFTTFGSRGASGPSLGASSSNYDSLQGFYRPDAPEAVMRKLVDYAMMIRDFKLAQSTYEILCQDFKNDKAWRYYAAANEMAAVSALLIGGGNSSSSSKIRTEAVDQYLETAYYSYITRVGAPYYALRTLLLGAELLKLRGGGAFDDAARWSTRLLDDRLVGPIGHALLMERIASCFPERSSGGSSSGTVMLNGDRRRKAAFWNTLAADAWMRLEKTSPAELCLDEALRLYRVPPAAAFDGMTEFLRALQAAVAATRAGPRPRDHASDDASDADDENLLLGPDALVVEPLQHDGDLHRPRSPGVLHRKSLSLATGPPLSDVAFDPLGAVTAYDAREQQPLSPRAAADGSAAPAAAAALPPPRSPVLDRARRDDGFE